MKNTNKLRKGFKIDGRYEITFPSAGDSRRLSFRAKAPDGRSVRADLIDLTNVPPNFSDKREELLQVGFLQRISHPNIAPLIDHGETVIDETKFAYLVFDFVGAETLAERLNRAGPFTAFKAVPLMCELLDAVGYLHELDDPLVLNALNPDSITMDYSGGRERPVITAFDQLRSIHSPHDSVDASRLSIFYAAPEVLSGIFIPQSDLFSVGACLYYLLFGSPPWFHERIDRAPLDKALDLLARARTHEPTFVAIEEVFLDDALIQALRAALAVDVNDRIESAEAFQMALKAELLLDGPAESTFKAPVVKRTKEAGTGFDAIAGMEQLKSDLYNKVIRPIVERERFQHFGIPLINGVLLYGPPGCGKTFVAERLGEEIGFDFIKVKPSDLATPYVHGGQQKIGELFDDARKRAPCLIFIDEFDAVVPSRKDDLQHTYAAEVNEILAQINNCGERGVFVLAATNLPTKIDPAVLRSGRFDEIIYLPQPDSLAREQMFRQHLAKRPVEASVDHAKLATLTENYVSSDIHKLVVEASRKAERANAVITMQFLEEAIKENPPSVSLSELKKYQNLHTRWTGERHGKESRTRIGFIDSFED